MYQSIPHSTVDMGSYGKFIRCIYQMRIQEFERGGRKLNKVWSGTCKKSALTLNLAL